MTNLASYRILFLINHNVLRIYEVRLNEISKYKQMLVGGMVAKPPVIGIFINRMRVLIACEESQTITAKYREKGIEAYSCDLKPAKINSDWHYQTDIFEVINLGWDLMIAHPPCTRLTVTGNKWYKPEFADRFPNIQEERKEAIEFFMKIANANINRIAIENPIGIMSSIFRKPNQVIQPYYFGDTERKATCLWLKNLPKLRHVKENNLFETKTHVEPEIITFKSGSTMSKIHFESSKLPKDLRSEVRSKTFEGIANAIVNQWIF